MKHTYLHWSALAAFYCIQKEAMYGQVTKFIKYTYRGFNEQNIHYQGPSISHRSRTKSLSPGSTVTSHSTLAPLFLPNM